MTEATEAVAASFRFESIKCAYRQTKDGIAVTLIISPTDVPTPLAIAPLGTRYMVAMVELGDDEKPVVRETPAKAELRGALLASDAADRKNPSLSLVGKQRYADADEMDRARTRAALLAKDPQFHKWAGVSGEIEAVDFIRNEIGGSRSLIATDAAVYRKFLDLEAQFLPAVGRAAEIRA